MDDRLPGPRKHPGRQNPAYRPTRPLSCPLTCGNAGQGVRSFPRLAPSGFTRFPAVSPRFARWTALHTAPVGGAFALLGGGFRISGPRPVRPVRCAAGGPFAGMTKARRSVQRRALFRAALPKQAPGRARTELQRAVAFQNPRETAQTAAWRPTRTQSAPVSYQLPGVGTVEGEIFDALRVPHGATAHRSRSPRRRNVPRPGRCPLCR